MIYFTLLKLTVSDGNNIVLRRSEDRGYRKGRTNNKKITRTTQSAVMETSFTLRAADDGERRKIFVLLPDAETKQQEMGTHTPMMRLTIQRRDGP